jgi:hypothetical protein
MPDSFCERCHNSGWALVVVNWCGMEKQATRPCSCPLGRDIVVDLKGIFRTSVQYVRESGYIEMLCPDCLGIHAMNSGGCPTPRQVRRPIPAPQARPPDPVEYASSGQDRAANDSGK